MRHPSFSDKANMRLINKYILSLLTVFGMCMTYSAHAQSESILTELQNYRVGEGVVTIIQDPSIAALIGRRMPMYSSEMGVDSTMLTIQGYRVQAFSGNNQRASKDEAYAKKKKIEEAFPHIACYVTFNAPTWRLRVGDFRSYEEAYHFQRELMKAFPSFGKEMFIVKEEVKIPLYN